MSQRDLYSILGVKKDASADEIKKVYRKLARENHPDLHPGDKKAEERFKEVSVANEVLSDAKKRKLYDEFGFDSLRPGFDPKMARAMRSRGGQNPFAGGFGGNVSGNQVVWETGGNFDIHDIFEQMFGGGFSQRTRRPARRPLARRGQNIEQTIEISLEEATKGAERQFRLTRPDGKASTLKVKIPAGVSEGDRIRLSNQGMPGSSGGKAGDLILNISLSKHRLFRREGNHLSLDVPITLSEAILGAQVEVPTLQGSVRVKIPAHSKGGSRLRLSGKGLKSRKNKTQGDLFAVLQIQVPDSEDPKLIEVAKALEPFYGDVRKGLR